MYATPIIIDDGVTRETFGPYYFFGFKLDMGFKYYPGLRLSKPASYIGAGVIMGAVEYRFDSDFTNPYSVPFSFWLYLSWGVSR